MPSLEQLFKERKNTAGPNTGKTAEEIYTPQDSKRLAPITSTNFVINKLNKPTIFGKTAGGLVGDILSGFDGISNMNKLRNTRSIRLSETLNEEEQLGLKQFATTTRPVLYGLDFARITNQRTKTLLVMKKATQQNVGGGLDDIIGEAAGNYAGDAVANFLTNGKKATLPPKPDLTAISLNAISDIGSRVLGSILPGPMIPSKVAEEFQKGYDKKKAGYLNEFDINVKIIDLKKADKVPGALNNVLKANKNLMAQTKDFLISTASNLVRGLVKLGTSALIRGSVNLISGNRIGKAIANVVLAGGKNKKIDETLPYQLKYSSVNRYSTILNKIITQNPEYSKQSDLEAVYLRFILNNLVNKGIVEKVESYEYSDVEYEPGTFSMMQYPEPHYKLKSDGPTVDINTALQTLATIDKPKYQNTHDTILKSSLLVKRGMDTTGDILNLSDDITYIGDTAITADGKNFDDYDFIPLKFYSYYKNETLQFRCTVTDLSEQFTPTWESNKFIGNPFNSYTYGGIERTLTFKFKVFSLNLTEHINAWKRLNVLAGLTYPQGYKDRVNAVAPPLIAFTLGDMYNKKTCFIDTMTFSVDENTPWEIGMNRRLLANQITPSATVAGYNTVIDVNLDGNGVKLPTIIDVDITLKFVESKASVFSDATGDIMYANKSITTITTT
jgi:hypothetical protein